MKRSALVNAALILFSLAGIALIGKIGIIGPRILDLGHLSRYFYFFTIGVFARKYQPYYEKLIYNQYFRAIVITVFFLLLLILDYDIWPKPVFHLLRDVVLRLLGTLLMVFLFASNEKFFSKSIRFNSIIREIGRKTLPIYLLQYFFIPNFSCYSEWIEGLDMLTVHIISFGYTFLITALCLLFIYLLEQSSFIKKSVLQQK